MSNAANGKYTKCVTRHNRPPRKVMQRYRSNTSHTGGWSHMHGHVQNVGPHLAAIIDGHETSQINTKHFTYHIELNFLLVS